MAVPLYIVASFLSGMLITWRMLVPRLCPRCNYYLSWRETLRKRGKNGGDSKGNTPPAAPWAGAA
jgi:hypothetical protein